MSSRSFRLALSAAAITCAVPWIAHAEYRCDLPPTHIDRNACKAAAESPAALRQYIQRIRWIESLRFDDYVNEATLLAWETARVREREGEEAAKKSTVAAVPETDKR